MAISKEYFEYISECLSAVGDVRVRSMMGGYLVYYRDKLVGDIGDGMLLVKRTPSSNRLLVGSEQAYPYEESRTLMWVVENPEDAALLKELFEGMLGELPERKQKKKSTKA